VQIFQSLRFGSFKMGGTRFFRKSAQFAACHMQRVAWKMTLEMVQEMHIEILHGGEILVN